MEGFAKYTICCKDQWCINCPRITDSLLQSFIYTGAFLLSFDYDEWFFAFFRVQNVIRSLTAQLFTLRLRLRLFKKYILIFPV